GLGKIRSEKATGLIVLHENPTTKVKEPTVKFTPDTAPNLAKIFMPECAVSSELIVTGNLVIADGGGKAGAEEHKVSHLLTEFSGLQLMKVGGILSTIDGSAEVSLGGEHSGFKWASKAA